MKVLPSFLTELKGSGLPVQNVSMPLPTEVMDINPDPGHGMALEDLLCNDITSYFHWGIIDLK